MNLSRSDGVRRRITRDVTILTVALTLMSYEIVLGEARATALTALTGLILSPLVLRLDEARRSKGSKPPGEAP
jgi:energy-converting hydrogenase Eha subunit E